MLDLSAVDPGLLPVAVACTLEAVGRALPWDTRDVGGTRFVVALEHAESFAPDGTAPDLDMQVRNRRGHAGSLFHDYRYDLMNHHCGLLVEAGGTGPS